jgi:DNA replication protein DnaC
VATTGATGHSAAETAMLMQVQANKAGRDTGPMPLSESLPSHRSLPAGSSELAQEALERERAARRKHERAGAIEAAIHRAAFPARHLRAFQRNQRGDFGEWGHKRDRLTKMLGSGFLVALLGPRGTGKTQLAVDVAVSRCRAMSEQDEHKGYIARYCKAMEIFLEIRACYQSKDRCERDVVDFWCRFGLLVIDELQVRGDTSFEDKVLTHVCDRRYDAILDTILISNQSEADFRESVGPSIWSRLSEAGGFIVCDWPSFRGSDCVR